MLLQFLVLLATSYSQGETSSDVQTRIVGGTDATEGAIPYQVSLRYVKGNDHHFCGGSIIGTKWILTAAHCMEYDPVDIVVVAGTNQLSSGETRYKVDKIIKHMDYNQNNKGSDDIALLRLEEEIEYTEKIQRIEVGDTYVNANETCLVSGWGFTMTGRDVPDNLQTLLVKVLSVSECNRRTGRQGVHTERELCTLNTIGEGTCQGNSGGPLECDGKLSAIVSQNIPCAQGYPDIYTRISSYLEWIQKNTEEE